MIMGFLDRLFGKGRTAPRRNRQALAPAKERKAVRRTHSRISPGHASASKRPRTRRAKPSRTIARRSVSVSSPTREGMIAAQRIASRLKAIEPQSPIVRDIVSLLQQGMTVAELKEVLDLPRLKNIKADTAKIGDVLGQLNDLAERLDLVPQRVVRELSDSELVADIKARLVEFASRHDRAITPTSVSARSSTQASTGLKTIEEVTERAKLAYTSQRILAVLANGASYKVSELSAETSVTRQWVYKVLYKGWRADSRHSLGNPDPDSLLGRGKIVVISTRVPFQFRRAESADSES
jgi:hypothetical protein